MHAILRYSKFFLFSFFLLVGLFALGSQAQAKDPEYTIKDPTYIAQFVDQSERDPIVMEPGSTKTVTVRFRNVGGGHWDGTGSRYISAYTINDRYRKSAFATNQWRSSAQTAKISSRIAPGQIGELAIELHAPDKPGEYTEEFHLAAENHTWVHKGYFFLEIHVVAPKVSEPEQAEGEGEEKQEVPEVIMSQSSGQVLFLSQRKFVMAGGAQSNVLLTYQNTGENIWSNPKVVATRPVPPLGVEGTLSFADSNWRSHTDVGFLGENVNAGGLIQTNVTFRAPKKAGTYTMEIALNENAQQIQNSKIAVEVEVVSDAPAGYVEPFFQEVEQVRLEREPTIRVGVWKLENREPAEFRSENEDYHVYDGDVFKGTLGRQKIARMSVVGEFIAYSDGALQFYTNQYVRMVPASDPRAVFQIMNHDRIVTWRGPNDFDQYRGVMEYRFTEDRDALYIINELGMEDYVAGIAEASNHSPMEYQKALLTAARTYAYYTMEHTDKHDKRNFDVVAHTGDQLYLGYVSEQGAYNNVLAARETRGQMIAYQNEIVVTPYYGNSDGRTRSWAEVWGGNKPWLVSVPAVYDRRDGKRMFGHGVGMSQRDAAYRAEDMHETWDEIIHYYYTDVDIVKMYH
ncbi:hypothetical protein H6758_03385 [Candidatus Nomurabacteria bacterium]|nr:hypothetical protein [Candidatus Nomurabacteria bacterium]